MSSDITEHTNGVRCADCDAVLADDLCRCGVRHGFVPISAGGSAVKVWPTHPCFVLGKILGPPIRDPAERQAAWESTVLRAAEQRGHDLVAHAEAGTLHDRVSGCTACETLTFRT